MKTVTFSGLALTLALVAAYAASEQSSTEPFSKEKLSYVRLYAWPKRTATGTTEVLFTAKRTTKADAMPSSTPTGTPAAPPTGTTSTPSPAPPLAPPSPDTTDEP